MSADLLTEKKPLTFWLFIIIFSVLGFAGNYLRVELFFNVDVLFGSIFAMLAVKYIGRYAILPAFIASLYTYVLWNHPYAIIIFTAETAFVSFFREKTGDMIVIDLIYWVTCGFAMIFVTYHLIMGMDLNSTLLIMLKQSTNGIVNTLIGSAIFHLFNYTMKISGRSYQRVYFKHIFFKMLVITAVLPALIFIIVNVKKSRDNMSDELTSRLNTVYNATATSMVSFFDESIKKEVLLSDLVLSGDSIYQANDQFHIDNHLISVLKSTSGFKNLSIIDPELKALSTFTKENGRIVSLRNKDFSSHSFFSAAADKNIYVSDVIDSGITGSQRNTVALVKTIKNRDGKIYGFIQGSIDFHAIKDMMINLTKDSETYFTLIDRHGNIVLSTNPQYEDSIKYMDRKILGIAVPVKNDVYQWTPRPNANTSVMTRWKNSYYIRSGIISDEIPLKLIGELPLNNYVEFMNKTGFNAMIIIFVMILLSILSAWLFSRRAAYHLTELAESTKGLPDKISRGETMEWKESVFDEVVQLTDNFRNMEKQLADSFSTLKLQTSELNLILDSLPLSIFMKDTKNNILMGNKYSAQMFGVSIDEMENRPVKDFFPIDFGRYYDDDLEIIKTGKPIRRIIQRYITNKGERTVITDKVPIMNNYGEVQSILVISTDITDDIRAQEEKTRTLDALYQQSKMAEMGAMIGAIAHQWKQPLNSLGLLAQVIVSDAEDGTADKESLINNAQMIMTSVQFMNQTINDFSGFFRHDKKNELFTACETIKEIYALIDRQFEKNAIEVVFHDHRHFDVFGLKNEFKQVCLNVLNNAKEALIASQQKHKRVDISYGLNEKYGQIIISDNAGGIDSSLLPDALFEMNKTTKTEGTGLGLYICKTIITSHMGGTITAENKNGGACFTITLPIVSLEP